MNFAPNAVAPVLLVASNPGRGSTFGFEFQPTTLAPSMPPFCTPWAPMARASATQRDSRLNIERPSAAPISASAPPPLVTRILRPREA